MFYRKMSENCHLRKDFFVYKENSFFKYEPDQCSYINKNYFQYVRGLNFVELKEPATRSIEWYPLVNSFYNHTEDVDAYAKANHLLGSRPSFTSLTSLVDENTDYLSDPFSETSAQIQYLSRKPLSFLLLGKPDIGQIEVGRRLAEYWNCVYLEPETLIREEILSGNRAGECIEFNLRCGRAIGIDVLLRLLEKRVKSQTVQHRGFVLCGFPLIPNALYTEDPVSSESAIFNVQEIFEDILDTIIEIGVPVSERASATIVPSSKAAEVPPVSEIEEAVQVEEPKEKKETPLNQYLDVGSITGNICKQPEISTNFEEQINFIFNLFEDPFMIIYLKCAQSEVIHKRDNLRYDVYTNQLIDLLAVESSKLVHSIYSSEIGTHEEEILEEWIADELQYFDLTKYKHLVKLPGNFPANVQTQLSFYKDVIWKFIETRVLLHENQYYIKVDGRTTPFRMFSLIKSRLKVLPLQIVLLPQKLNTYKQEEPGEDENANAGNAENQTLEEVYTFLRSRDVVNNKFKWSLSDWGFKCPVSMKEGYYRDGDPHFAVQFMNRIFFLSDEQSYFKFYKNPRPYLLPPYPKPSCRIFVFGPKNSGKTTVSRCLAYLLNGTVLTPTEMEKQFNKQKEIDYLEKIRQAALTQAMTKLNETREQLYENKRKILEKWLSELKTLYQLLKSKKLNEIIFPIELSYTVGKTSSLEFIYPEVKTPRTDVDHPNVQFVLDDIDTADITVDEFGTELKDPLLIEAVVSDEVALIKCLNFPDELNALLPEDLRNAIKDFDQATAFDKYVIEFANKVVQNCKPLVFNDLTDDERIEMFIRNIKQVEDNNKAIGNNRGGWIIDDMPLDMNLLENLAPEYLADDVFILTDDTNSLYSTFGQRKIMFRNFRQLFLNLNKVDAAWRCPNVESYDSYNKEMVQDILYGMLDNDYYLIDEQLEEKVETDKLSTTSLKVYKIELNQYKNDIDEPLELFKQFNIEPYIIDIGNKSMPTLLTIIVKNIEGRFRQQVEVLTDEQKYEEYQDFAEVLLQDEEIAEDMGVPVSDEENVFEKNRRYGDTYKYCPVCLHEDYILWRGREEYTVRYENKIYMLRGPDEMNKFIFDPKTYVFGNNPPKNIPPLRICVVGSSHAGKTTIAKALSSNFALCYVNYMDYIKKHAPNDVLNDYLNNGTPFTPDIMLAFLQRLWCKEREDCEWIVIDDFPKRPQDILFMVNNKFIPDLIINVVGTDETYRERFLKYKLDEWRIDLDKKKNIQLIKNQAIWKMWNKKRKERFNQLIENKRQQRFSKKQKESSSNKTETDEGKQDESSNDMDETQTSSKGANKKDIEDKQSYMEQITELDEEIEQTGLNSPVSGVSVNSVAEQNDINEVNDQLDIELPEPIFEEFWELQETARARYYAEIDELLANDYSYLSQMKEQCTIEYIPWFNIDANKSEKSIIYQSFVTVDRLNRDNNSVFERCYLISMDVAERLLACGYYFLSKFGRTCPVQYYDKNISVQLYLAMEEKFSIFPTIHRHYIYFIAGEKNSKKFQKDPLKYTLVDFKFPLISYKVAITGSPKCGKTCLAKRFRQTYIFNVISRGKAIRYVLRYMPLSYLGIKVDKMLRKGITLSEELTMKCVEAATYDSKSLCQGTVFDGFPNSFKEIEWMNFLDIFPQFIVNLDASPEKIHECLFSEPDRKSLPRYSEEYLQIRINRWKYEKDSVIEWLAREYQNISNFSVVNTKWQLWKDVNNFVLSIFFETKHYHTHAHDDWPLRIATMLITPLEFLERISVFKTFCPVCLHYTNTLKTGGEPPDRQNLIHFRKYFYWLCNDHVEEFLDCPEMYLPPYCNNTIPTNLPKSVVLDEIPENVYGDGICMVCYSKNTDTSSVIKGTPSNAVNYADRYYLFDSKRCLTEFILRPYSYFAIEINLIDLHAMSTLDVESLPVIGYLEQYVSLGLRRAISEAANCRPVIPGLSITASAAIYIGLYLVTFYSDSEHKDEFRSAWEKCNIMKENIKKYLAKMKKIINPYVYCEEAMPKFTLLPKHRTIYTSLHSLLDGIVNNVCKSASTVSGASARRVPVPDERFDYLCEYFKPVSKVPAFLNVVDIAGLVKGASEGQGLGNAFLSHISACDAIFHLCRAFEDDDVTHIEGDVNPVRDLEIIAEELRLKDEETLTKNLEKLERTVGRGLDKKLKPEYDTLLKVKTVLFEEKKHIRFSDWDVKDIEVLNKYLFLTSKPGIYLVNLTEKDYIKKKNKWLIKIKEWVDKQDPGALIIPFSGVFEHKLVEEYGADPALKKKFLEDNNTSSALDKIVVQGYKALQLEYFFTAGADEVKAWTIQKGTKAPQAAGRIHTDFEKGFIMAEVMKFADFKEEGSEASCKAAGKYRQQGRNYTVEDGDIIFFKFNAGAGLKDAKKK